MKNYGCPIGSQNAIKFNNNGNKVAINEWICLLHPWLGVIYDGMHNNSDTDPVRFYCVGYFNTII